MSLTKKLSGIHNKAKLYSRSTFELNDDKNIIQSLKKFKEFQYLYNFFIEYSNGITNDSSNQINVKEAKNIDLPFIGENVLLSGKVKFMFVFEGSLQDENGLSITVLSHLWLIDDNSIIDTFCGTKRKEKWWLKSDYLRIKRLNVTKEIAKNSYVVDAVRFAKKKKCTDLLWNEIELLKPELVICVGNKARDLVGMRCLEQDTKFHHIKFPSKRHNDNKIYSELNRKMNMFL